MNFIAILLAIFSTPALAAGDEPRFLSVGVIDVVELAFEPAPNPLVGNKAIVELRKGNNPKQLMVVGLKQGTSSVHVTSADGKVTRRLLYTVSADLTATVASVRKLLKDVEGVTVEARDGIVVVDGEVLNAAEKKRVLRVVAGYEGVLDLTTISKLGR